MSTDALSTVNATASKINWNKLPTDVPSRCCDSEKMRQATARAFAALTIVSTAATLYAALYLTAVPFTVFTVVSGLAALTTALAVTTVALDRMKPSLKETLVQQRTNIGTALQSNPNLGVEQLQTMCPDLKGFTAEEMNVLMHDDAKTMEYAAFMTKHGRVLNILNAVNVSALRQKFLTHLVDTALVKDKKTWEQIVAMSEVEKFSIAKEDINALLSTDAKGLSYAVFVHKYTTTALEILDPVNLASLKPSFLTYLTIALKIGKSSVEQLLQLPVSKIFGIKAEDLSVQLSEQVVDCPTYDLFVSKYGIDALDKLNAFERATLRPSYIQSLIANIDQEKHSTLQEILDRPVCMKFGVKKEEIAEPFAKFQVLVVKKGDKTFENFDLALFAFLPEGKDKQFIEDAYRKSIMDKKCGLIEFEAIQEDEVFSKDVIGLITGSIFVHEMQDFKENISDYFLFKTRNGLKWLQTMFGPGAELHAKARDQFLSAMCDDFSIDLTSYAQDLALLSLTEKEIKAKQQEAVMAGMATMTTFPEVVDHFPSNIFDNGLVDTKNPKFVGLVVQYVLANPDIFMMEKTTDEYASIIINHKLMSKELAEHMTTMRQKHEAITSLYNDEKAQLEMSKQTKATAISSDKDSALKADQNAADIQIKTQAKDHLLAAYESAVKTRNDLHDAFNLAQVRGVALDVEIPAATKALEQISQQHQALTDINEKIVKLKEEIQKLSTEIAEKEKAVPASLPNAELTAEMEKLQKQSEELQKTLQELASLQEQLAQFPYKMGTKEFDDKKAHFQGRFDGFEKKHGLASAGQNPVRKELDGFIVAEKNYKRLKELENIPVQLQAVEAQMKDLQKKMAEASKAQSTTPEISALKQKLAELTTLEASLQQQAALSKPETTPDAAKMKLKKLVEEDIMVTQQIATLGAELLSATRNESAAEEASEKALLALNEAQAQLSVLAENLKVKSAENMQKLEQGYQEKLAQLEEAHKKSLADWSQEFSTKIFIQVG